MTKADAFIISSSDQVPRRTGLKRFPIPRNYGVSPESRIEVGRTWPAPEGATRIKRFEIYRYDPDGGDNPHKGTQSGQSHRADQENDCGPTGLRG